MCSKKYREQPQRHDGRKSDKRQELQQRGKDAASRYLERIGMKVTERGWQSRADKVDFIGWDDDVLVLIEVKTRRGLARVAPEEAVSVAKQRRLARLAREYVSGIETRPQAVRFDVIALYVIGADRALLRHHRNAFTIPPED